MMSSQASGDHARQERLQAEEKLPGGEGDENSGMEVELLYLEKMSVMNLDDKSQDLALVLEDGAPALNSGKDLTLETDDSFPAQLDKVAQHPAQEAGAQTLDEDSARKHDQLFPEAAEQDVYMYEDVRQYMLKNTGPESLERVEALMTRFGSVTQVHPGMEAEELMGELEAIGLEILRTRLRANNVFQATVKLIALRSVKTPGPEMEKRVNEQLSLIASVKEATREIRRRAEEVDKAASDRLTGKRQGILESLLNLEKMGMNAEQNFEKAKPILLKSKPNSNNAEENNSSEGAEAKDTQVPKIKEPNPVENQGPVDQEYESIRRLIEDNSRKPVSFEGLKALMERVKVAGMNADKCLDEIQLEYIRLVVRLHYFFSALLDAQRVKDMQKHETHYCEINAEKRRPEERHHIAKFQGLEIAARNGRQEIVKRVNELKSELGAIKEATTGIQCRAAELDKAAGDRLMEKRQKMKVRLLQQEKAVADAENYFEGVQLELLKPVPNSEPKKEPTEAQVAAEIDVQFVAYLKGCDQLHELSDAIGDIY